MILNILAVGDVVGDSGLECLDRHLRQLKKLKNVHFTVVNGENASRGGHPAPAGPGPFLTPGPTWSPWATTPGTASRSPISWRTTATPLRPANYTNRVPGRGWGVYEGPEGLGIGVINLIGRCEMDSNFENPFTTADRILKRMEGADIVLVDFHAEATSEKGAMGYYLDGRVQALWGTHTHVPTADGQILPKGTGFITDLGMTGPARSVLGIRPEQAINRFLGGLPRRFEPAEGPW